ncbi:MAG: hypothetical protein ABIA21_01900 [Candidatus Aenigmatarchaeota archaeon]
MVKRGVMVAIHIYDNDIDDVVSASCDNHGERGKLYNTGFLAKRVSRTKAC